MSTPIGNHGLSCLDDNDFAAIPLSIQSNAQATDSALSGISAKLTTYINRPWFVATRTTSVTGIASGSGAVMPDNTAGAQISGTVTAGFGFDTAFTQSNAFFALPQGWYRAGFSCSFVASGAVTANSIRRLYIVILAIVDGVSQYQWSSHSIFESSTGGDSGTTTMSFHADGVTRYQIFGGISHLNTGSTLTVNAGAKIWSYYEGTGAVV